jgi:hypothetical protein
VTGSEGGNEATEAYLYDADAGAEPTVCISCLPGGAPAVDPPDTRRVATSESPANAVYAPRALVVRDGRPVVFFTSFDSLAPGSDEGEINAYEWTHGQVFLVAAEPPGLRQPGFGAGVGQEVQLVGASEDGTDVYIGTPQSLTWEDGDARKSLYDARIGGGWPAPAPGAAPCDQVEEGSCKGPDAAPGPAVSSPTTNSFNGPGNPTQKKHHKKKHHKKKHHKKKHHKKNNHANRDRGTAK